MPTPMRPRPLLAALLFLSMVPAAAQLNGTYTINGGGGGDYTTFTAAVADLVSQGVSGPVLMNVAPGTYTEQVNLPAIAGTSAANTITFRGTVGDSAAVTLTYGNSPALPMNFTVRMQGADHVTFEHMTISRTVSTTNGCVVYWFTSVDPSAGIRFRSMRIIGLTTLSSAYLQNLVHHAASGAADDVLFERVRFENGDAAISWTTPTTVDDALRVTDCVMRNGRRTFYFEGFRNVLEIDRNDLSHTLGTSTVAITVNNCGMPLRFARNRMVISTPGGVGWRFTGTLATVGAPAILRNNEVIGTSAGTLGFDIINSENIHVLNNSLRTIGTCVQLTGNQTSSRLVNNALRSNGNTVRRASGTGGFAQAEHNVLFSSAVLAFWGVNCATLAALQTQTGQFANSFQQNPLFVDEFDDLHLLSGSPCLQTGLLLPEATDDMDGDPRPLPVATAPDIGADESPLCVPLAGTYIIGASGVADFPTFTAAINAMVNCGINAPVLFLVENGTYTEQIALPNVPGNSNVNTITFRGQSLNNTLVILTAVNGSTLPTVLFTGADRVTFEHLTIRRTGAAGQPGIAVDFENTVANGTTRSEYPTLRDCRISTTSTVSSAIRGISQNDERTVTIADCIITGGQIGVDLNMESELSVHITGSTFSGQGTHAIRCHSVGAGDPELYIMDNDITGPAGGGVIGILVEHNSNNLEVTGNRVLMPGAGDAALRVSANGGLFWTWVRNNMLICTGVAKGLVVDAGTTGLDISYNSISVQGSDAMEFLGAATDCRMVANALQGTGPLLRGVVGTTLAMADHNLFHTPGSEVAFWSGQARSMGCLRTVTGQHADSFRADPRFVDPLSDLHVQADSPCKGNGSPTVDPITDFDGTPRALPVGSPPDIGADEVDGACTTLAGTYLIGPSGAADFPAIGAAVNAMKGCGITGPVLFNIENGTYTEQVVMDRIKGSSAANTITFRSLAMDSTAVIWQWPHTSATHHVVALEGADHLRFEQITMRRTAGAGRSDVVLFRGTCDASNDIQVRHCRLIGSGTLTAGLGALLGNADAGSDNSGILLIHSRLLDAPLGVGWDADGDADAITIQYNIAQNCGTAVQLQRLGAAASVRGNTITLTNANATGVHLVNNSASVSVDENRLRLSGTGTGYGMLLNGNTPPAGSFISLRNNSVIGIGGNIGIQVLGSADRVDILHNSVRSNTARALWINASGGAGSRLIGNMLSSNNAVALYRIGTFTFAQAERNILHSNVAPFIATWGGDHATIAALQGATGQHTNSFNVDPRFYDPANDLRSYAMEADMGSMTIAGITVDIDGQPRDATNPDIGAYEFQPLLWDQNFNTCAPALPIISTGSGADQWIYRDRRVVARFNDNGQVLGTVNMNVYVNTAAVRQSLFGQYYLDRNWHLSTQNPITAPVNVRLFHSGDEFTTYAAADPIVNIYADAGVAHYAGLMENCQLLDNPPGNIWTPVFPAAPALEPRIQGNGGTHGYTALIGDDGELYITTMGLPLPVELISFTGERLDQECVLLEWITATEQENEGFEVWRMIEGEDAFTRVGWVDGAGHSTQMLAYAMIDPNTSEHVSYYQLRQVDHDGSVKDSQVIAVQGLSGTGSWVIAPNPARDRFSILGIADGEAMVMLIDGAGRPVREWSGTRDLSLDGIPPGLYVVRIRNTNGEAMPKRLVVQ